MSFTTAIKNFLSQDDIKILIISGVSGTVVQIICRRYMKNHPELFEKIDNHLKEIEPEVKPGIKNRFKKLKLRRFLPPRGGAMTETAVFKMVVEFLAKHGTQVFVGCGIMGNKFITRTALTRYFYEATPQAYIAAADMERKRFMLVDGKNLYIDIPYCEEGLKWLLTTIDKNPLPYDETEKTVRSALNSMKSKLGTMDNRVRFVMCLITMLCIFSATQSTVSSYLLIKELIKAIKAGRISKVIGRALIRKMRQQGLPVDPELLDAVNS